MTPEEVASLRKLVEEQAQTIKEQAQTIRDLRVEISELKKDLEKWKRGFRTRKQRFSSAPEAKAKRAPRAPGRPAGHAASFRESPPDAVADEVVDYAVPVHCTCGGLVAATTETERVIEEEIPQARLIRIEHCAQVGKCLACGKRVMAQLPGAAPGGMPFARVVLGRRAQALCMSIRYEHHVSFRSTTALLAHWFGLHVSAGGISQIATRRAVHTGAAKEEIRQHIVSAAVVGVDETGLRQSGKGGWVWLFRTPNASYFEVSPSRGSEVFERIMHGFIGVLVTDFYSVYTARTEMVRAYCGAHLVRAAKEVAELDPTPVTREFADKIVALYKKGEAAHDFETRESVRNTFHWMTQAPRFRKHPELARLGNRIHKHFEGMVAFLGRDDIPWHNNASERDIRPIAIHRNIVRGTRSPDGANALGHWMSVTQTLRKNGSHLADWLPSALDAWRAKVPLPSVFYAHS